MPFSENNAGSLTYMTSSALGTVANGTVANNAVHAFTTRSGGVSRGIFSTLNLGQNTGDQPEDVRQNYSLLGTALGFDPEALALSRQVHGTAVRLVTRENRTPPFAPVPYEADALITAETDVPLMIFTADCVPILLFDPVAGVAGAVHAGWRGTAGDIAGKAVGEMTRSFGCRPADIRAAIGPSISACCYETGRDVADVLRPLLGGAASAFVARSNSTPVTAADQTVKYLVDLKGANGVLLERAGLMKENIDISPECTACLPEKYWSHRVTHGRRGSQASVIMMTATGSRPQS